MVHQRAQVRARQLYQDGGKGRAICPSCAEVRSLTWKRVDVPFSDGEGLARNILAGVCDTCGNVIAIPAQSTPAIRAARRAAPKSLEANVPGIFADMLDLVASRIDETASPDLKRSLIALGAHELVSGKEGARKLGLLYKAAKLAFPEKRGVPRRRISFKVSPRTMENLRKLARDADITQTEVITSLAYGFKHDVIDRKDARRIKMLQALAVAAG